MVGEVIVVHVQRQPGKHQTTRRPGVRLASHPASRPGPSTITPCGVLVALMLMLMLMLVLVLIVCHGCIIPRFGAIDHRHHTKVLALGREREKGGGVGSEVWCDGSWVQVVSGEW